MKFQINYCPQCGGDVISHYKTHVVLASYNEFYCEKCFVAFRVEVDEISEKALAALGYCPECKEKQEDCICENNENPEQ